ncbi:MAG: Dolichyl-phosphate-mannose-protein mannosyltransferase [Candidatus Roizmanbacteria bacterium GW2011_GWA2_36_23]|uniref:Dolichyl-phosphate-mannose-protein mannosyltransferase n=1 Tax=Candidatus Roizmanbacteria bacterium GW2011_GWA2_36_23 TaxID=1618480 RepID=A0A0G0EM39_9BACT|nr:MAG: Dolichyl-phosphate-mannose-protein mannosyltransferase [Candidatus Roizmanbacteria bacterium GW2011_GWA2_36_23]
MFSLAIIIGLLGNLIFLLGLSGFLFNKPFIYLSLLFLIILFYLFFKNYTNSRLAKDIAGFGKKEKLVACLVFIQIIINLVGALGPELGFDSLWYHLTLPKLYASWHQIRFVPGWLLYYSALPKLTEMFYLVAVILSNELLAKLIHFTFGILILFPLYELSRKYLNKFLSLLAVLLFYTNLVVGWMSITAYIDLSRTYFEIMSFLSFVLYLDGKKIRYLIFSAIILGFAASAKLIAIGSMVIYLGIIGYVNLFVTKDFRKMFLDSIIFVIISIGTLLPWLLYSYINTGNPVYPLFAGYPIQFSLPDLISPINIIKDMLLIFTNSPDPIHPVYLIAMPLILSLYRGFSTNKKILTVYFVISLTVWYFTPRTGGGRFLLPYLPVYSLLVMMAVADIKNKFIKFFLISSVFFLTTLSIAYRSFANLKFLPVILGRQTKSEFLSKNLRFHFGDFYDIDGYFTKTIKKDDKVLIYGIHNLYYVDFPFIHESYLNKNEQFNYILVGEGKLPEKYSKWRLVYKNDVSKVKLYVPR